jgi:hypothetical protein
VLACGRAKRTAPAPIVKVEGLRPQDQRDAADRVITE